jgi:hypothetical protein
LIAGVQPAAHGEIVIIRYEGAPQGYSRPKDWPDIHLDVLCSPMAIFSLLPDENRGCTRWIVVDPHQRIRNSQDQLALAQILAPGLQLWDDSQALLLVQPPASIYKAAVIHRKSNAAREYLRLVATRPEGRHSVANVVGPLVLQEGMGTATSTFDSMTAVGQEATSDAASATAVVVDRQPAVTPPHQTDGDSSSGTAGSRGARLVLKQILTALKLIPGPPNDETRAPWLARSDWEGVVDKFVLIDDMHALGWADFVRCAADIPPEDVNAGKDRLLVCDSPSQKRFVGNESLLDLLEKGGKLRTGKGISFSGSHKAILLLDLRLTRRGSDAERDLFTWLRRLARQTVNTPQERLPWRRFEESECRAVETALGTDKETEDYYTALTFLPRLIALVDPSLPIMLFSTTGQRTIIEKVRDYGNVITAFDKPRFFGAGSADVIGNAADRFREAMDRALTILRGRNMCRDLTAESVPGVAHKKLVEIYIDESWRSEDENIAGLAVGYPNHATARTFSELMRQTGIFWGPDEDAIRRPKTQPLDKRVERIKNEAPFRHKLREKEYVEGVFSRLAQLVPRGVLAITAFRLDASQELKERARHTKAPQDYLHRQLVQRALEALLLVWPATRSEDIEIAVYVGTRVDKVSRSDADDLALHFGIRNFPLSKPEQTLGQATGTPAMPDTAKDEVMAVTFPADAVRPMVDALFAGRRTRRVNATKVAKAVRLKYYGDDTKFPEHYELPRQIHFVADLVASFSQYVPEDWWLGGFREEADNDFDHLLRASRLAEISEHYPDALVEWSRVSEGRRNDPNSVARWVRQGLRSAAAGLMGNEFIRFCKSLSDLASRPARGSSASARDS